MESAINPYAAPKAVVDDVGANAEAEATRREHISHEASIKAVGMLYYLGGFFMAIGAIAAFTGAYAKISEISGIVIFLLLAGLVGIFLVVGRGLRTLKRWARVPTAILAGLGLLGFPIGTLINGYILWLVLGKKGKFILSEEYAAIVAATPDVKYGTSIIVWIFLALIAAVLIAVLIPAFSH